MLLTLARVVTTVETGTITTKDRVADHLLTRVPDAHRAVLVAARDDYLGVASADWSQRRGEARDLAAWCAARVEGARATARIVGDDLSQA